MAKKKEIKVQVQFTEGYEKRFTEACLEQLRRRELAKQREADMESKAITA